MPRALLRTARVVPLSGPRRPRDWHSCEQYESSAEYHRVPCVPPVPLEYCRVPGVPRVPLDYRRVPCGRKRNKYFESEPAALSDSDDDDDDIARQEDDARCTWHDGRATWHDGRATWRVAVRRDGARHIVLRRLDNGVAPPFMQRATVIQCAIDG